MVDRETKHSVHFQAFSKTEADINEVGVWGEGSRVKGQGLRI
jgi:hypothetical protein